jgi:hypothetical protein
MGPGNLTNEPVFVSTTDLRLAAGSPCIDAGSNAYVQGATDLDGNPRVVNGIVDIGAYEFRGGPIAEDYWQWAAAITNGLTDYDECATGDGYPNLLKYATGSSPTMADDLARMDATMTNGTLGLVFRRNAAATDVTMIVEGAYSTSNQAAWAGVASNVHGSWGAPTNVVENAAVLPAAVTVWDAVSQVTNRFMRLRVTRP